MAKTIVVTGASRGIGRAACEALVKDGWSVVGIARSAPEGDFPGLFIEADLADAAATLKLAGTLAARGDVVGIVNNAGLAVHERMGEVDYSTLSRVMDLNVGAALQLTQALLPAMRQARFGRIVNVTSLVTRGYAYLFRSNNPTGSEGEARHLAGVPLGRFAQPAEIAAAIAFLAGDQAAFITARHCS